MPSSASSTRRFSHSSPAHRPFCPSPLAKGTSSFDAEDVESPSVSTAACYGHETSTSFELGSEADKASDSPPMDFAQVQYLLGFVQRQLNKLGPSRSQSLDSRELASPGANALSPNTLQQAPGTPFYDAPMFRPGAGHSSLNSPGDATSHSPSGAPVKVSHPSWNGRPLSMGSLSLNGEPSRSDATGEPPAAEGQLQGPALVLEVSDDSAEPAKGGKALPVPQIIGTPATPLRDDIPRTRLDMSKVKVPQPMPMTLTPEQNTSGGLSAVRPPPSRRNTAPSESSQTSAALSGQAGHGTSESRQSPPHGASSFATTAAFGQRAGHETRSPALSQGLSPSPRLEGQGVLRGSPHLSQRGFAPNSPAVKRYSFDSAGVSRATLPDEDKENVKAASPVPARGSGPFGRWHEQRHVPSPKMGSPSIYPSPRLSPLGNAHHNGRFGSSAVTPSRSPLLSSPASAAESPLPSSSAFSTPSQGDLNSPSTLQQQKKKSSSKRGTRSGKRVQLAKARAKELEMEQQGRSPAAEGEAAQALSASHVVMV